MMPYARIAQLQIAVLVGGVAVLLVASGVRLGMAWQERQTVLRCLDPHVVVDRWPQDGWRTCPAWYSSVNCGHDYIEWVKP